MTFKHDLQLYTGKLNQFSHESFHYFGSIIKLQLLIFDRQLKNIIAIELLTLHKSKRNEKYRQVWHTKNSIHLPFEYGQLNDKSTLVHYKRHIYYFVKGILIVL